MTCPRSITAAAAAAVLLCAAPADAQERIRRALFFDEADGALDVSDLLARGGFLPMPIIITEPAVDQGFGIAGYFVRNPPAGSGEPPTRTIVGGARTGNGSNGYGFMRSGAIADGRILYNVALGEGLAVLDFYPGNRDLALTYNNDILFAGLGARYRFGDTGYSAGGFVRYRSNDIALDAGDAFAELAAFEGRSVDLPSVGLDLHFDNRDNPLTPTAGLNAIGEVQIFDEAIGSDADFTSASLFGAWFATRDVWTLGIMGDLRATSDDTPFFMEPDIDIRGVPRNRYRGDQLISSEIELRRQLTDRWGALGFLGYGRTFGSGSADAEAATWGGGVRYRIARKLGLDVGIDIAFGPDQEVVYLQFGHAWSRRMD